MERGENLEKKRKRKAGNSGIWTVIWGCYGNAWGDRGDSVCGRSVQPVLAKVEEQYEEAASLLGASRIQIFFGVIFPEIRPALIAGFTMAFARSIGEYGSVVFIAGNTPYKTEIAPLMIMAKLQEYDYASATSIALVMLVLPLVYVIVTALRNGLGAHLAAVTEPYAVKAILLTIQVTVIAVVVNTVFGLFASWLITKFQFHGKKIFSH